MEKKDQAPGKVLTIESGKDISFFRNVLSFLKPVHHLTANQTNVLAHILYYRYELSKSITNQELLDRVALGVDSRKKIREELGMSKTHFQVVMSALKKGGIISEGTINQKFIPNIKEDTQIFKLAIYFKFNE